MTLTKTCTKCLVDKELSDFHRNGSRLRPDCKACVRKRVNASRTTESEQIRHAKREYGLTLEEANQLWFAERCAICGATDPQDQRGKFQIDHCHKTGAVRGALCKPCNVGIGWLRDDHELLRRAADYLEERCQTAQSSE